MKEARKEAEDRIEGKNAVMEALKAGRPIDKIYLAKGEKDSTLDFIARKARAAGAVISETDRRKLDAMSVTHAHQGVIAVAALREYDTVEHMLERAAAAGQPPLLVVCDEITDPHNLGAIIRSAECVGAHGVIIPRHRSAGMTAVVEKTSAGAVEHMAVARVTNLASELDKLKKQGLWIYGTAAEGDRSLWTADFREGAVIVIGSEGEGMSRLVREKCDFLVSIPIFGRVTSLNASAAASVVLYEAIRQRTAKG